MVAFVKAHPKGCTWAGLIFGVFGLISEIQNLIAPDPTRPDDNPVTGFFIAFLIIGGCSFLLIRWRLREQAAKNAEIAARADAQHQAFLAGDDFGVFGTRETPPL
ncbi:hypothetical protein [Nocardia sp. 852002-20019_SCH5090214]|uniref:hypothetical protein n=1 Tax=Nocardia sp. 852002-20019_SCH5090214 TaxID=1834087 RepID=UPI0012E9F837|nr:hypothetical protein [Nocardia sp. 852002-20019_SCH5090214]